MTDPATLVEIVEVSPRDGLQNEKRLLPTDTKIELVRRSVAAGLRRVEVTAFARPDRVPQMADAEDVLAGLADVEGLSKIGLVLNRRGLDRALAAGCDEITAVVVASDGLAVRNQGVDTAAQVAAFADIARDARAAGMPTTVIIAAAFGCPFDGEVPTERVLEVARGVLDAGPDEVAIADTIGVGVPAQVTDIVTGIRALDAEVPLRAHFHNTRNTGYANALAAVAAGVTVLDASAGGIGGCPFAPGATGNIGTEDLLYLLERSRIAVRSNRPDDAPVDALAVAATGTWIATELGLPQAPAMLGRAGWFPRP
ncbi:hydroxymethylglutaryl-CoA lyase [Nocardioides sp. zg-536]|uniref:Hydroxymethylglutaryl-CoA lyase n=1 Tax=Nocardioides faecalis TaxID=2803858 RepID=A0A938Y4P2_9ACTN|nr:hydroxymethylglutaryl-CoA lyase [Nocardioides faecalis]MBM9459200.1 hydroxymethylglutaryl-CoA lyase [Nocardioides faecalis]MBS4751448.1 hydroxymethylglutaryl-CoA lyase [Nocardioides faecalis]QVI59660.1 hydroxymethylglutaryl-CoA lyase [Nocardioides faecalis]